MKTLFFMYPSMDTYWLKCELLEKVEEPSNLSFYYDNQFPVQAIQEGIPEVDYQVFLVGYSMSKSHKQFIKDSLLINESKGTYHFAEYGVSIQEYNDNVTHSEPHALKGLFSSVRELLESSKVIPFGTNKKLSKSLYELLTDGEEVSKEFLTFGEYNKDSKEYLKLISDVYGEFIYDKFNTPDVVESTLLDKLYVASNSPEVKAYKQFKQQYIDDKVEKSRSHYSPKMSVHVVFADLFKEEIANELISLTDSPIVMVTVGSTTRGDDVVTVFTRDNISSIKLVNQLLDENAKGNKDRAYLFLGDMTTLYKDNIVNYIKQARNDIME